MLLAKLILVPLIIAAVTFAGQRWGSRIAGLLGGLPVIAGPIVILLTLDNGHAFGVSAALAAIFAIAALLGFGVAYAWASVRWPWWVALLCGLLAWLLTALCLAALQPQPLIALTVAIGALVITPLVLPRLPFGVNLPSGKSYIVYRMAAGTLLATTVTGAASILGATWSGLLAVFPVIALVLAVFTHRAHGAGEVIGVFRGMVQGLYSFLLFFFSLYLLLPQFDLLTSCTAAIFVALFLQSLLQWRQISRAAKLDEKPANI
jgi:hypothetical protein